MLNSIVLELNVRQIAGWEWRFTPAQDYFHSMLMVLNLERG
jgi:hypothetical protein